MLSVKQEGIKYNFWVFGLTRPGIKTRFPDALVNILLNWPMGQSLRNQEQMKFIFQDSLSCGPHTSSVTVAMFGSNW